MKIRFLHKFAGHAAGEVVDLDPAEALVFIEAGAVDVLEEPQAEVEPAVEPKKGRRR